MDLWAWKQCDINTDSLWIIPNRAKGGKHENNYHGNFIPQIPNELIRRYTKSNEVVLDAFLGSGTTLFECENLGRKCIGMDINEGILQNIESKMQDSVRGRFYYGMCDNTNNAETDNFITQGLETIGAKSVQFMLFHPPYMDIVKFTNKPCDLSQMSEINDFMRIFLQTCQNTLKFLDKNRYFAVVIGDVYKHSEIKPLGFYVMRDSD